jgi:ABC-2 type transport system ATP-binding protein
MGIIVDIANLTKIYGHIVAVNNVTLKINSNEIYGLLGPNGSGKSTLLKMMVGLTKPTNGYITICGFNPVVDSIEVKRLAGYTPELPILYESLTPAELFNFLGAVRNIRKEQLERRVYELAVAFGISDRIHDFIGSLSFGTKQKVAIISSLIH